MLQWIMVLVLILLYNLKIKNMNILVLIQDALKLIKVFPYVYNIDLKK